MKLDGWCPEQTKDVLSFGTMVHWFLEHLYRDPYEFIPEWRQKEIADEGVTAQEFTKWTCWEYTQQVRKNATEKGIIGEGDALVGGGETSAMARPLVEEYIDHWGEQDSKLSWIGLEQLFDVDFHEFRLRGKVDGIFSRPDGTIWIFETKTKGQISPEDIGRALKFDFQSLFYVTAVEIMLGKPVTGVLYNVLRRTQLRRGANEPESQFWNRISSDIHSRPDFYFYRTEAIFTPNRKKEFREILHAQLCEFKKWLEGDLHTYPNETSCTMRKWNCEFLGACASGSMAGYNQDGMMFSELEE